METKAIYTKKELADRWGLTEKTIDNMRREGTLKEIKTLPGIRFHIEHIEEIERYGLEKVNNNQITPMMYKRLELELQKVKKERDGLKEYINRFLQEGLRIANFI